jgi:hypothetical protein
MNMPALTTVQMVEVDRLMIEEYGSLLIQMMENAGRNLADISVPPELYERLGMGVGKLFEDDVIVAVGSQ